LWNIRFVSKEEIIAIAKDKVKKLGEILNERTEQDGRTEFTAKKFLAARAFITNLSSREVPKEKGDFDKMVSCYREEAKAAILKTRIAGEENSDEFLHKLAEGWVLEIQEESRYPR
jgi:hypothetical protein